MGQLGNSFFRDFLKLTDEATVFIYKIKKKLSTNEEGNLNFV